MEHRTKSLQQPSECNQLHLKHKFIQPVKNGKDRDRVSEEVVNVVKINWTYFLPHGLICSYEGICHGACYMSFWWGDGTSRNEVSPCECSRTPGPQINRPLWYNVPALIYPCNYAFCNTFIRVQNARDVSMQGQCVSGTIHFWDQGSLKIRTGTHRFGTSRHPTVLLLSPSSGTRHPTDRPLLVQTNYN